jgi:hypothetical protein
VAPLISLLLPSNISGTAAAALAATDAAAAASARVEARRFNFISCLILTAQNGFGRDVDPFVALCRETWGEEILFDALKDLPHGKLKLKKADGTWLMVDEARADGTTVCVRAVDPFGKKLTRVMYAAQAGYVARLQWLIARGARLELKDWEGRTALYWASREGRVETVRELLQQGAAIDAAINTGATPLFIASQKNHLEVVRELLARGAAVDAAKNNGATPQYIASQKNHLEVVRELLARGAAVGRITAGRPCSSPAFSTTWRLCGSFSRGAPR